MLLRLSLPFDVIVKSHGTSAVSYDIDGAIDAFCNRPDTDNSEAESKPCNQVLRIGILIIRSVQNLKAPA
jgi:hypothetical protein